MSSKQWPKSNDVLSVGRILSYLDKIHYGSSKLRSSVRYAGEFDEHSVEAFNARASDILYFKQYVVKVYGLPKILDKTEEIVLHFIDEINTKLKIFPLEVRTDLDHDHLGLLFTNEDKQDAAVSSLKNFTFRNYKIIPTVWSVQYLCRCLTQKVYERKKQNNVIRPITNIISPMEQGLLQCCPWNPIEYVDQLDLKQMEAEKMGPYFSNLFFPNNNLSTWLKLRRETHYFGDGDYFVEKIRGTSARYYPMTQLHVGINIDIEEIQLGIETFESFIKYVISPRLFSFVSPNVIQIRNILEPLFLCASSLQDICWRQVRIYECDENRCVVVASVRADKISRYYSGLEEISRLLVRSLMKCPVEITDIYLETFGGINDKGKGKLTQLYGQNKTSYRVDIVDFPVQPNRLFYMSTPDLTVYCQAIAELADLTKDMAVIEVGCKSTFAILNLAKRAKEAFIFCPTDVEAEQIRTDVKFNGLTNCVVDTCNPKPKITEICEEDEFEEVVLFVNMGLTLIAHQVIKEVRMQPKVRRIILSISNENIILELAPYTSYFPNIDIFVPERMIPVDTGPNTTRIEYLFSLVKVPFNRFCKFIPVDAIPARRKNKKKSKKSKQTNSTDLSTDVEGLPSTNTMKRRYPVGTETDVKKRFTDLSTGAEYLPSTKVNCRHPVETKADVKLPRVQEFPEENLLFRRRSYTEHNAQYRDDNYDRQLMPPPPPPTPLRSILNSTDCLSTDSKLPEDFEEAQSKVLPPPLPPPPIPFGNILMQQPTDHLSTNLKPLQGFKEVRSNIIIPPPPPPPPVPLRNIIKQPAHRLLTDPKPAGNFKEVRSNVLSEQCLSSVLESFVKSTSQPSKSVESQPPPSSFMKSTAQSSKSIRLQPPPSLPSPLITPLRSSSPPQSEPSSTQMQPAPLQPPSIPFSLAEMLAENPEDLLDPMISPPPLPPLSLYPPPPPSESSFKYKETMIDCLTKAIVGKIADRDYFPPNFLTVLKLTLNLDSYELFKKARRLCSSAKEYEEIRELIKSQIFQQVKLLIDSKNEKSQKRSE